MLYVYTCCFYTPYWLECNRRQKALARTLREKAGERVLTLNELFHEFFDCLHRLNVCTSTRYRICLLEGLHAALYESTCFDVLYTESFFFVFIFLSFRFLREVEKKKKKAWRS